MFISLVKIKKYLIYLFLFLLFNFFFDSSLKANPTFVDGTVVDNKDDDTTSSESDNIINELKNTLSENIVSSTINNEQNSLSEIHTSNVIAKYSNEN